MRLILNLETCSSERVRGEDADDTIGVHSGVDGEEVEVEGEKVVVLLGLHVGVGDEVLVEVMDDVNGFEDRCDLDLTLCFGRWVIWLFVF